MPRRCRHHGKTMSPCSGSHLASKAISSPKRDMSVGSFSVAAGDAGHACESSLTLDPGAVPSRFGARSAMPR